MKNITAPQLAYLLGIKVKDARKKIEHCFNELDTKGYQEAINIDDFENITNLSIRFYIDDIYNNALKNNSFKGYLLNLPLKKLLKENPPRTITFPKVLRSMMQDKDVEWILSEWRERYTETNFK